MGIPVNLESFQTAGSYDTIFNTAMPFNPFKRQTRGNYQFDALPKK